MIGISRFSKLIGAALAVALVAAACGGDSTSADTAAQAMSEAENAEADAGKALADAQAAAAGAAAALAAADAAQAAADLARATADGNQDAVAAAEAALQEALTTPDLARSEAAFAHIEDDVGPAAEAAGEAAAAAGEAAMDDAASEPTDDAVEAETPGTLVPGQPDINGDGQVILGIASPGDTNDGGFYQSFVDGARSFAEEAGWTVIVSDFINPAESETAIADLARQNVDFLAVGATELQDGLDAIACSEEFEHIAMYLNGTLTSEHPCYGQSSDNYFEIHWLLGVAAAQLLERTGGTKAGFIGGPELAFVVVASKSMEAGLKSINPDYELVVTYTGSFNDAALGIEAARAMIGQDIGVIHTFLGGAMFPTGGFIAENGGAAMSASANTCFPGSPFAGASLFPPGDYLVANLRDFAAGTYREGAIRRFYVGINPEPGAILCDPTSEEQATLDDVIARIGSRDLVPEELIELSG